MIVVEELTFIFISTSLQAVNGVDEIILSLELPKNHTNYNDNNNDSITK